MDGVAHVQPLAGRDDLKRQLHVVLTDRMQDQQRGRGVSVGHGEIAIPTA